MKLSTSLDYKVRLLQNFLGPTATRFSMGTLGANGTRFVRELLGRSARHRVQMSCNKELIGVGNGAWTVCPDLITEKSIIYSLGVGSDVSFDLALIETFAANVYAFDPTPKAISWVRSQVLPERFHFVQWGISDFDGFAKFDHLGGNQYTILGSDNSSSADAFLVYRLKTTMEKLAHEKIDLLKINIEGGEYRVIEDMMVSKINVSQIVLEFHHRFPGYSLSQTETAVKALNREGYKIFNITDGKEYSFIRA